MGETLGVEVVIDINARCKWAKFDPYFSESICRKYGHACRVACMSCRDNS